MGRCFAAYRGGALSGQKRKGGGAEFDKHTVRSQWGPLKVFLENLLTQNTGWSNRNFICMMCSKYKQHPITLLSTACMLSLPYGCISSMIQSGMRFCCNRTRCVQHHQHDEDSCIVFALFWKENHLKQCSTCHTELFCNFQYILHSHTLCH